MQNGGTMRRLVNDENKVKVDLMNFACVKVVSGLGFFHFRFLV